MVLIGLDLDSLSSVWICLVFLQESIHGSSLGSDLGLVSLRFGFVT